MELFLPSLFILTLVALVVFLVLPRFTPFVTVTICSLFLILAGYSHFKMYSNEYKNLMFLDMLRDNYIVIIGIVIVGLLLSSSTLFTGIKIKIPRIIFTDDTRSSSIKDLTNIPFDKIRDLERQV
jgi:hypothetical protein